MGESLPEWLGGYRLLRQLVVDGEVRVLEARDEALNRFVIIHWLAEDTGSEARESFLGAARALAGADCRHLPTVFEIASHADSPYCVLESPGAGSLDEWLTGFPPSIRQVLRTGRELAAALAKAESLGLTPMSLSLNTVWLERPRDGVVSRQVESPVVKLRDFRAINPGSEDAARQQTLDGLGVILIRLLSRTGTGRSPTEDDSLPPLTELTLDAPAALIRLVGELQRAGSEPSEEHLTLAAAADRLAAIERRESRRRTQRPATASIVAAAGVLFGLTGLWFGFDNRPQPQLSADLRSNDSAPVARDKGLPVPAPPATTQSLAATAHAGISESEPASGSTRGVPQFESLSDGWLEIVRSLPAQQQLDAVVIELRRRNPDWDGEVHEMHIEDDRVRGFRMTSDHIEDITPLSAFPDLEWLACPGKSSRSGKVRDLSPLAGLRLRTLRAGWTQVRDLSPLAGMPLRELKIGGTQVTDLTPLAGMAIEQLEIWGNSIQALTPLAELSRLKVLRIGHLPVRDLSPLAGLPLESLDCENIFPLDWSPLTTLPLVSIRLNYDAETHHEILRSIPTLQEINGQPAAEVLGE